MTLSIIPEMTILSVGHVITDWICRSMKENRLLRQQREEAPPGIITVKTDRRRKDLRRLFFYLPFQSLTQESRDFNHERNAKSYLLSDMGYIPASEIEPPADRRVAHRKTPTVSRNSRVIAEAITIDSIDRYMLIQNKRKRITIL